MIRFNLSEFLNSNILDLKTLSFRTKIPYTTLYGSLKRNRIKARYLAKISEIFPNAKEYILSIDEFKKLKKV